ncbi:MAG: GFA family protein [Woeseiaceae bacterium]|nr:GFA family protein [Woeseiaceae bacterium]
MTGFLHLIVGQNDFRLLQGADDIETYTFNTGVARHIFCRYCGIKSYYVPRSHPDGISVNINCLQPGTIASLTSEPFDGRNWEKNISQLSRISD